LRDVYAFVPDLSTTQEWTDAKLYMRYGLTQDEIRFIESQVAEHTDAEPYEESNVDDE
jgi:site-specific DNA-methyltransferase (adenine-specific)